MGPLVCLHSSVGSFREDISEEVPRRQPPLISMYHVDDDDNDDDDDNADDEGEAGESLQYGGTIKTHFSNGRLSLLSSFYFSLFLFFLLFYQPFEFRLLYAACA